MTPARPSALPLAQKKGTHPRTATALQRRAGALSYRYDMMRRDGTAARVWTFIGWCAALSAVAMIVWAVA